MPLFAPEALELPLIPIIPVPYFTCGNPFTGTGPDFLVFLVAS